MPIDLRGLRSVEAQERTTKEKKNRSNVQISQKWKPAKY